MKTKYLLILWPLCMMLVGESISAKAQSTEAQQLLLNVEKLSQLKNILRDMKKGYTVISNGYSAVKNISKGNFSLHELFLDGMMLVSPEVKKYSRISDIITAQKDIVSGYRSAFKRFRQAGVFDDGELKYIGEVYSGLFARSLDNLNDLSMVLTSSVLRMGDDERLQAIDRIFEDTKDKLLFLRGFNAETTLLILQRKHAQTDLSGLKLLFDKP